VAITEARRIAGLHGVTLEWVQGQENSRLSAMVVRRVAFALRCMGLSLPQIGRMLNRHHSTILSALRHVNEADKELTSPSIRSWADLPRV
jgi:chromosomal replication initiation ATPase DnaA